MPSAEIVRMRLDETGRTLRRRLRGPLFRLLVATFARLPFSVIQRTGAVLGGLLYELSSELRRVSLTNLGVAYPDMDMRERRALARRALVETGKSMAEAGAIWRWEPEAVLDLVTDVVGEELLDDAYGEGRGVIMLSPHIGAWELAGLYLSSQYTMTSMYRPPRAEDLGPLMRQARERAGAQLVPTDASGVRAVMQALKRGEMVGLLPDQDPGPEAGVFAPFFGKEANTMTLVSRLAQRTGAPTLFIVAERLPGAAGFRLHVEPASPELASTDLTTSLTALNADIEALIRRFPEQFQWGYRRYRTRPAGEPKLY